jgi:hypothetical protein
MRKLGAVGVILFAGMWQGCSCSQNNNVMMMMGDAGGWTSPSPSLPTWR